MKRMQEENLHEVVDCPQCKAICLKGHDEDGQVFCAVCGGSFKAEDVYKIDDTKLRELYASATRFERSGWTAFKKN